METNRRNDINGFVEIKGNPLSKVGIFEYSGSQISAELDPDKIYKVYRPEEELSDEECIESFKLLPWTDEHEMLGTGDGLTPAEKKGVHGVIGEDVYFEDGYLKGNIKIFSEKLGDLIDNGKKELSIGYRCMYDLTPGEFQSQLYDVVQRHIRGNHVALVAEGRAGPDVAVLDEFKFTCDTKGLQMENEKKVALDEGELSLSGLHEMVKELTDKLNELMGAAQASDADEDDGDKKDKAEDADEDDDDKKDKAEDADEDDDKNPNAMDKALDSKIAALKKNLVKDVTLNIQRKTELAERLSHHVGVFDHANLTIDDVAKYGVKKLGISCDAGEEHSVLIGYLSAKTPIVPVKTLDSKPAKSMQDYFKKGSK